MSDKESFFYFQGSLKDWAKTELDRRGAQTFDDAIAIAESLTEYSTQSKDKRPNQGKGGGESRKDKANNCKDWKRIRSTLLLPNSRATPQCPRRNPDLAWVLSNVLARLRRECDHKQPACSHTTRHGRATHNFVSVDEAKCLGLKTTKGGTMKMVNSPAKPIVGIAQGVHTTLGCGAESLISPSCPWTISRWFLAWNSLIKFMPSRCPLRTP